eukprot:gnl/MRDRNA2_/MRDRNA2_340495_c0_seq1.p1 gnl/MRDRNA2_/MRDRNA2_340495_c0~~gnl/MRDRNA2_/MRDRNA2_340495_c0_seq1.p1  ORF type:complete len:115 (+),score=7.39 gnl/MRDRNA2_/MRDRNA2_340495_c0_seq1:84-428(+)
MMLHTDFRRPCLPYHTTCGRKPNTATNGLSNHSAQTLALIMSSVTPWAQAGINHDDAEKGKPTTPMICHVVATYLRHKGCARKKQKHATLPEQACQKGATRFLLTHQAMNPACS